MFGTTSQPAATHPQPDIPPTMRALQFDTYGAPDVLKYVETRTPTLLTPHDVLVKVHAAGVNPIDCKARSGNVSKLVKLQMPVILGGEFSGVVVGKGDLVVDFETGNEVFGMLYNPLSGSGAYAEYVLVNTIKDAIAHKPTNMTHTSAGSVAICLLTAYTGLIALGNLPSAPTTPKCLIIGASGGVGHFAVQIAKASGAHVVGVCSSRNAKLVHDEWGADRTVDYTSSDFADVLRGEQSEFDVVLDCVGGDDQYNRAWPLLKPTGQYVTAVGPMPHIGAEPVRVFDMLSIVGTLAVRKVFGARRYKFISKVLHHKWRGELREWLAEGKVKSWVPAEQIFELKDGAKGHALSETNRAVGKIVLIVA
ncbi:alcohol dehydrogenase [Jimgerdemannia flammicorona]|uniref:Alcohol dehydrogenase n=1 Tax=Jimgerdemannia flammicorona TaxID=994334 RepID=A0A433A2Q6_9FUNG|nr:alcohol dehydrogenase [Jimgerdemannia flammicorona]